MILVDEYMLFPTNTLYEIRNVEYVPSPAFTICPKPSLKFSGSLLESHMTKGSMTAEHFQNNSISLIDVVVEDPFRFLQDFDIYVKNKMVNSSRNGEKIHIAGELHRVYNFRYSYE